MPQIDNVSVTNINTGANWVTGQQATAPAVPFPLGYHVYANAAANNQPPVGFLNNPAHQFVIQGRYLADLSAFVSGFLAVTPALSDPPLVYVF